MPNLYRYSLVLLCLIGLLPVQIAAQEGEQPTIEQRLDRMERLLSSQGLMDMLEQLRDLQEEVRQLRGEIEVQNHKIDQLQQRQRNLYADIDQRMRRLEGGGSAAAAMAPSGNAADDEDSPPLATLSPVIGNDPAGRSSDSALTLEITGENNAAPGASTQPDEEGLPEVTESEGDDIQPAAIEHVTRASPVQIRAQYQEAFGLLKQSRYDQAIRKFTEFLSAYPDSEYSDNAQYWLAEAYYVTRDFEPALEEYRTLINVYPDSQKRTHGLLKMGYTLQELGRLEDAKQQLQDLIAKHPGTTAARLAEDRLKRINSADAESDEPSE